MSRVNFLLLGLTAPGTAACRSGSPSASDSGGTSPGVDPTVPAGPDEARAGFVTDGDGEAALFGGLTAEGRAGDIKLYNDRVQVIIQGPYRSHGYIDTGGQIIDLDLVAGSPGRDEGVLGRDLVEDLFLSFSMSRLFHADTVEIVADGSDGGAAVVSSRGSDVPWGFFQGLFEYPSPIVGELHLDIETTYTLPPASNSLGIRTTFTNDGSQEVSFTPQDSLFGSGEDMRPWAPGLGFQGPETGTLQAAVFTGRQGEATFSFWSREEEALSISVLSSLAAELGIFLADHQELTLAPGESVTLERSLSIGPDVATVEAERRSALGESLGQVSGTVTEAGSGTGVAGVRVHLVDDQGSVAAFAATDSDGRWSAELPAGSWQAWAVALGEDEVVELPEGAGRLGPYSAQAVSSAQLAALDGSAPAVPLPYPAGHEVPDPASFTLEAGGSATADLLLQPATTLQVAVRDDQGNPLPAVLSLRWADGLPPASTVPDSLKQALDIPTGSRAAWAWTSSGDLELSVRPGRYTLSAGHSWRHGRDTAEELEVEAGETLPVELILDEVVPRDGWLAMDSHLHAAPSMDGALPMEHRLVTCAATGVDLPVMTDHDALVGYRDLATALDLDLQVFHGWELTTLVRGHFNLFPVTPSDQPNGGAIKWWEDISDTEALLAWARQAAGPNALLQVNHPRTPGMNDFASYDPQTGEPAKEHLWSWDFDAVEVLNGGVDDLEEIREDWFSFLNFGHIRLPIGVSDSHYRFIPCGLGRTDVLVDSTNPHSVDDAALVEALRSGHVVVASGTTLRASMQTDSGQGLPGDTLVGDTATLSATVRAPDWIQPGTLRIYENGQVIHEQELSGPATDGLWLDSSWELQATEDAWFAIEVQGSQSQGDTWRNAAPYALTNAFFLDVEGDGWTAIWDF